LKRKRVCISTTFHTNNLVELLLLTLAYYGTEQWFSATVPLHIGVRCTGSGFQDSWVGQETAHFELLGPDPD